MSDKIISLETLKYYNDKIIEHINDSIDSIETDKQDTLVSGSNIKTINGESILGSGDITIEKGTQVQSDWNETDTMSPAYIANKPNIAYDDTGNLTIKSPAGINIESDSGAVVAMIDASVKNAFYLGDFTIFDIGGSIRIEDYQGDRFLILKGREDGTKFLSDDGTYKTLYTTTEIDNKLGDINDAITAPLIHITYSELKSLRDNSQLTPGSFYRITDYVTTTTQSETKSANHPFDVIVLALSENTLSEDAKAILHEGDTYFADSDLNVWELKYCLDNDKTSFWWADETNGKGVIYRMIDEKRNDCPYDFKNILFYNNKFTSYITSDKYYYTFSYIVSKVLYDGTTEKQAEYCHDNVIKEYRNGDKMFLNENVFRNINFFNNCAYNTLGFTCHSNTFGFDCHNNTFGYNCTSNIFENGCNYNTFVSTCQSNIFGPACGNNTFGYNCDSNTFGDNCDSNTFGDNCDSNTFGDNCSSNTFGNNCHSNNFGDACYSNNFGNNCSYNTFRDNSIDNTFGSGLQNRYLDTYKTSITLNEEFYDDGSGQLVPIKHPDLSTQPSILPYKFMGQYVYEQLIPVNKGDRIVNNEFIVETPMIMSAEMFSVNSFKNINILAAKSNALLLDTSSELDGYINVKYTDGSILLPSDGYYYGSISTSSSNNSSIDFGVTENGTVYIYDNDNDILTLSKNDAIYSESIPTQYKNSSKIIIDNNVTSIRPVAFHDCSSLTSIEIPNSVTSIGDSAFSNCTSLTSIEIPNSVTSIGEYTFSNCSSLTSIEIPNSVTSIGDYAFNGCIGLTSVEIGNSVTSIENYVFENCSSLTSIVIPNNVTSIRDYAFKNCSSLTSIEIGNSVTSIGDYIFSNCSSLTSIIIASDNPKYDSREGCNAIIDTSSNTLKTGCKSTIIPNSVTSIRGYAFSNCTGLTSIEIPNSVTSIGDQAFSNCSSLISIEIPNSVTSIGRYPFSNCSSLTSIIVAPDNPKYDSREGCNAIIGKQSNVLIIGCKSTIIPNSVTSIGNSAFSLCRSLTSIVIPNNITSIGEFTFSNCSSLTSVEIGNSVTSIGSSAFQFCTSLTSVTIPNSVTSIGSKAFSSCSSLTSVTIPNNVTSIGFNAFSSCSSLTSVTIPNNVTSIDGTFSDCTSLTSIEIPNSVTSIGGYAFNGCIGLTSVEIGNSVTSIGSNAFKNCSSLTSIEIPNSVTSIGSNAFIGCIGLTSITCKAINPPSISLNTFAGVSKLKPLYVPAESVEAYKSANYWKIFTNIQAINE